MWFPAVTVAPPEGVVIDLDRAKDYLRVDGDDQDDTVSDAIASALGHVERYTSTRLLTQTVELRAGRFNDLKSIPIGPIQSLVSVTYLDTNGDRQPLDPSVYELFGAELDYGIREAFQQKWPSIRMVEDGIVVRLVVGYGNPTDVPAPVYRAALLLLGDHYLSREDTILQRGVTPATLPNGVDAMLCNYRINA